VTVLPCRQKYPWKLGATSFVIPASVEENVQFLAGMVDDIQLLFFESSWKAQLPHAVDVEHLARLAGEHGHSYTVHLPLDLQLGSPDATIRQRGMDEICRIVEQCHTLEPQAYDLHLNRETHLDDEQWCTLCLESLLALQGRLGSTWDTLCVENVDYDFGLIADVVQQCGLGVCVDFGHLHHHQFSAENWFSTHGVNHVHLHGVTHERDHQPLCLEDIPFLQRLAQDMVDHSYGKVVTLELYKADALAKSLAIVHRAWQSFRG
jgi:sugar phosphate isomerase/epimerase